ncbi:MAG: PIN domain-containing protein, partial [Spirochaetales bacterium]|nr:PIN domain-containing protein [Spirochaetales bacterium]
MIVDVGAVSAILAGRESIKPVIFAGAMLAIPVIVVGEYRYALSGSSREREIERAFDRLIRSMHILTIDERTAEYYAVLRRRLAGPAHPPSENGLWIAALARQYELPILSRE